MWALDGLQADAVIAQQQQQQVCVTHMPCPYTVSYGAQYDMRMQSYAYGAQYAAMGPSMQQYAA